MGHCHSLRALSPTFIPSAPALNLRMSLHRIPAIRIFNRGTGVYKIDWGFLITGLFLGCCRFWDTTLIDFFCDLTV